MGFELGKGHFDGIEVGAIGWEEEEPGAAFFEDGVGLLAFVTREIVEDDHVAGLERGGELGFDIGLEDTPVHGCIDDPGRGQTIMAQGGDERLSSPVAEGSLHPQPLPPARSPPETRHFRSRPSFVDKDEPFRALLHPRLTMDTPHAPGADNVSAIGFARQQRFF
jgi:hypothetical protein